MQDCCHRCQDYHNWRDRFVSALNTAEDEQDGGGGGRSVDGKLLRGDIKGRAILVESRPGDQMSRVENEQLDQINWLSQLLAKTGLGKLKIKPKDKASLKRRLREGCLKFGEGERLCHYPVYCELTKLNLGLQPCPRVSDYIDST